MVVVVAYFKTKEAADRAVAALESTYKVSQPEPVTPVSGRPWVVEITLPPTFGLSPTSYVPETMAHITAVVNRFDGHIHSGDTP